MGKYTILIFLVGLGLFLSNAVNGQSNIDKTSELMKETKWKYTYALHLESNTIIHQAESFYEYFLYFRYNYQYQEFLNGKTKNGNWSLNDRVLFYQFRNIKKFEIAELSKNKLVLEFTQANAKGTYQYHFIRVETAEAPFLRPSNQLPEVNVEAIDTRPKEEKKKWWVFGKRKKKKEKAQEEEKLTYLNIELIGGGYYGGLDPVLRDFIRIKSNGRLIKEFKSINSGLIVTKKNVPRSELEEFVDWVEKEGYFGFERMYDCQTATCAKRKRVKPTPIPLRIAITKGSLRKVITISIWGKDENKINYVDYPPVLDEIIDYVQRMGHRAERPVAGK